MSPYFLIHSLRFSLIMMFRFRGSAGLSGCRGERVNMQSVGDVRNACRHSLLQLVQNGTIRKCPSFCCKDFLMTFVNFRFMLMSIFDSTVQSVPCHSNNMRQAGQTLESRTVSNWFMQCKRIR